MMTEVDKYLDRKQTWDSETNPVQPLVLAPAISKEGVSVLYDIEHFYINATYFCHFENERYVYSSVVYIVL